METTSEKTASGMASRTDSNQIETAFKQVQKTALEVWMSIGFTMALYLMDKRRQKSRQVTDEQLHQVSDSQMRQKHLIIWREFFCGFLS